MKRLNADDAKIYILPRFRQPGSLHIEFGESKKALPRNIVPRLIVDSISLLIQQLKKKHSVRIAEHKHP